jgi:hypothetical protein
MQLKENGGYVSGEGQLVSGQTLGGIFYRGGGGWSKVGL